MAGKPVHIEIPAQDTGRAQHRARRARGRKPGPDTERGDRDAGGLELRFEVAARSQREQARPEARPVDQVHDLLEVPLRAASAEQRREECDPDHAALASAGTRRADAAGGRLWR